MHGRNYSRLDHLITNFDQALRTLFGEPLTSGRGNPAQDLDEQDMTESEKVLSARLMRINHAGEVCAQALYQGQALTARSPDIQNQMEQAAREENDHLVWCSKRVDELGGHTSYLNTVWYAGSFAIGAAAGVIGDKWSLGFLAETERQVVRHLDDHLEQLPEQDSKTRAIVEQMKEDEARHATGAVNAGGRELPEPVRKLMKLASKVMTKTTYRI